MPYRRHPVRPRARNPHTSGEWNRRELHPDFTRAKRASSCWTTIPSCGRRRSDQGGGRTHNNQALNLTPLPVGVPGRRSRRRGRVRPAGGQLRTRESNWETRLMRPGRVPTRPQVADLGVEPSIQAYETRSGAGPPAIPFAPARGRDTPGVPVVTVGVEPTLDGF